MLSMEQVRAAIVDDEDEILDLIEQILKEEGIRTKRFHCAEDFLSVVEKQGFDLIISDLMLPGISGLELLQEITSRNLNIPFVLITGYASLDSAIDAVNKGAFFYIKKPFNIEEIRFVIQRLHQKKNLMREIDQLKEEIKCLQAKLKHEVHEVKETLESIPEPMRPFSLQASADLGKALSAIEHLGRLKIDGLISEKEFGEYKGKLLRRIV
ncbi:MAG TPA: response regulator [Deltaproteobacteria bacterium]|nr:response regulator [Deltaproteobacteria bacterium]